ncbi:MAG TPA: ribonuclease D [Thermomonas sp.]|jgi:ribonuclease D|uniref:ribonuclease D n=1 Tax=Thermomonas sp. TaxID=1971895 RepID=UPI002BFC1F0E|nr:ribonuclease D [Thermomonas sp.]HOV95520.1 ribonuclease D [Thermomonas sp.]
MTHWIDTPAALHARLHPLPASIGLDTEFIRERTYWPQLALVQIALGETDDDILLVDPQAPGMCAALVALLENPAVLKLMHSPSEDLVAFQHSCGALPTPMFDTQAAAALCGLGAGLSYQKLVQAITEVALAKGETRSDWLRRPLSASQLEYAADDVRHLHALHRQLQATLAANGRAAWLDEDSTRQLANAADDAGERWPHLALRGAQILDQAGQHRLLRLLRWRDAQARSSDRPRSWILDNELALTLARQNPADKRACDRLLDAAPKSPRSLREALWQALITPLPDEADAPRARGDDRDKTQLRALQAAVADVAAELDLPEGILASRRLLESLQDSSDWNGALSGWRRQILEPRLAPLLARTGSTPIPLAATPTSP